jgi:alkaline phosphatase
MLIKVDRNLALFALLAILILALAAVAVLPGGGGEKAAGKATARNVIVFVGDGMGPSTVTAARWYKIQNGLGGLNMDTLSSTAVVRTESADSIVTDSAAAATALFSGHKTNSSMLNVYGNDSYTTILEHAKEQGKSTGIITTSMLTDATPAGCYARAESRSDEQGIGKQLYDAGIDVIMGGGSRALLSCNSTDPECGKAGTRTDGDLIKAFQDRGYRYVYDEKGFESLASNGTPRLLAVFDYDVMRYEVDRAGDMAGEPSLAEMTAAAIRSLSQDPDGYFLMVEGGNIDHASHDTRAYKTVTDTVAFDDAVGTAMEMVNLNDTLVIVVADHSHTLTIGGYPSLDTPILGVTTESINGTTVSFPIISFGTGIKGYNAQEWANSTIDEDLMYPAASLIGTETHGGETVNAYAVGPGAEKLHGTMHLTGVYDVMHEAMA